MSFTIADLQRFLDASPSPFHVAATVASRLTAAGFEEIAWTEPWATVADCGFVRRDGAVVAWKTPAGAAAATPFTVIGGHTDSPCLRVKPAADLQRYGWRQLNVEVYGSILNNSWLDRDLALAGRITTADGEHVLVNVARPIARIPQLAVHLDRGANDALTLDPQAHLRPVWGTGTGRGGDFADWLLAETGHRPATWDIGLYDAQPSAVLGSDNSLLAAGRLDNQLSCWAATGAMIAASGGQRVAVMVLNDHEEVGSESATGAAGAWLEQVLERHVAARRGDRNDLLVALAGSRCVSADNAHAIHPNYPERHDAEHAPIVNHGPAIKVNANQRYATSAATAAWFSAVCDRADVPHQTFVSRNNMPCGSTIGPLTATRLGIDTVDVGIPQLSMHSARELCGVADPPWLAAALTGALNE